MESQYEIARKNCKSYRVIISKDQEAIEELDGVKYYARTKLPVDVAATAEIVKPVVEKKAQAK